MFDFWKRNKKSPVSNQDIDFQKIGIEDKADSASGVTVTISEGYALRNNPSADTLVRAIARDKEQLMRGPKLRFTEDVKTNLELLQSLVPSPELIAETISLGTLAPKKITLVYIGTIANPSIVSEVKRRIKTIKARTLYESSYIQRTIEDSTLSPFPQVKTSECPDVAVSALFQGRVAVLLDGSPNTLLAPCTFWDLMDTSEDAYSRWFIAASFFKIARYIMLLLAGCLPGFYIALLSYNPEMLPTRLLLLILNSREGTPFPVYFEVFLMMGIAEAVRMMLIRTPTILGSTVALFSGITLIIAGIYSNIIGSILVIVVTLTVLSSFGIPDYDLRSSIRIIQFMTMVISSFLGLFGFALSFFVICIHLSTLKSFGIPYMAPLTTMELSAWGHTLLRTNSKEMPIDDTYKPQEPQ